MTAIAFWQVESILSILIFVLYVIYEYGIPALLVGLIIWWVSHAGERRRALEIEEYVNTRRQVKEMMRRDKTR